MVHRPADSRLLANLLSHEKDYSKHLATLLEHSQLSLASFSAYASASSPPLAQAIITVAGALSGADDALRKYAMSVESWQAQLNALKGLEDEVGNIMRDREILVTRLIKASKSQKPNRDSVIGSTPSPSSSSLTIRLEVPVGAKLGAAQTELQACEAHLAKKERELEEMRVRAITVGLQARCKAMVECGWVWGEMGKEGLRALDSGDMAAANGNGIGSYPYPRPSSNSDSGHAASDLSSLAPSQSASQLHNDGPYRSPSPPPKPLPHVQAYRLQIAPAHSIDEHAVPDGRPKGAPRASWRISEVPEPEEEEGGGSSADEEEAGLEVHENERFARRKSKGKDKELEDKPFSIRPPAAGNASLPPPSPSTESGSILGKKERHRSGSGGLFGRAFDALFHRDNKEKERGSSLSPSKTSPSKTGGWRTRTDSNLTKVRRGGKGGDESSDDEEQTRQLYSTWSPSSASVPKTAPVLGASASTSTVNTTATSKGSPVNQRLKKAKRSSVQAPPRTKDKEATEKGWVSDTAGRKSSVSRASSVNKTPPPKGKGKANGDATPGSGARPHRVPAIAALGMNGGSVSRNSSLSRQSITSVASAPARMPVRSTTIPVVPHSASATSARSRAMSLQPAEPQSPAPASTSQASASSAGYVNGHRRTASTSSAMPNHSGLTRSNDGPSLMSIVEGVARHNKEAWSAQDPNRKLIDVRAPPPVNVDAALEEASKSADKYPQAGSSNSASSGGPLKDVPARQSSPLLHHTKMPASASAPTLPVSSSRPLMKVPLRSALRHSSRTPSPNPPPAVRGPASDSSRDVSPSRPMAVTHAPATPSKLAAVDKDDDETSLSSYATGREDFDEDSTPVAEHSPELSLSPPPPPPHDSIGSDLSGSSTTTEGAPVRRKSVRMSLPPTFSATPPAVDDDSDEEARSRHAPWGPSSQWSTRIQPGHDRDVWQDSSEEDEDYSRARRLLSRMSRGRT
ncbi:uncharacterized protein C8Q71DRAFT_743663 [Rhodofomes roseus]|uniref:Uncharacterized protein n=1 Tax=Rhodofomes roseus TaxID=34475 RepID=A0ABQ8KRX4_9APHY|nr:uncharacterized protein C8Q71DRAFT_743663 [Rhodofomes roseus]KAH9841142.1 hypothetical protein C8Q71DRAFT_743663 [Rhodofomes roseus]